MINLLSLAQAYIENEFYESALIISQTIPMENIKNAYFIIKSLYYLKHFNKIKMFIKMYPKLLEYKEILFYYIKSGNFCEMEPTLSVQDYLVGEIPNITFSTKSLQLLYNSYNKKYKVRKKYLIDAFKADPRNIEPLCVLLSESLAELDEIFLITKETEYDCFIRSLFKIEIGKPFYSPIFISLISKHLFKNNKLDELFRFSIKSIDNFPNSEFSHESLGLFYLAKKQYTQSRIVYMKVVDINKNYGFGYLGMGISECCLLETEKGINFLGKAFDIMDGSYLPSYFLAYEYQQMNDYPKAKHFYINCLNKILEDRKKRKGNEENNDFDTKVINSAIYCLIYNEDYHEAKEYLNIFKIQNLLNAYCCLFLGELDDAREMLKTYDDNCKFVHGIKGFLLHLTDNYDEAINEYEKSISIERTQVIENLLIMALQNKAGLEINHAFDYSNCLFNSLEFKQRYLLYYL